MTPLANVILRELRRFARRALDGHPPRFLARELHARLPGLAPETATRALRRMRERDGLDVRCVDVAGSVFVIGPELAEEMRR